MFYTCCSYSLRQNVIYKAYTLKVYTRSMKYALCTGWRCNMDFLVFITRRCVACRDDRNTIKQFHMRIS